MTTNADVIVLGAGAMGAAACSALARRGASVLALEQHDVPHALGSSGGQSRLVRKAYFEHPDYVPLLRRAYDGWDALAQRSGTRVLERTGCLYAGRPESALIAGTRAAAAMHGIALEELDRTALAARYPAFRVPERFAALFEPDAGFVPCERAVALLAEDALRHGARIHARERVASFRQDGRSVRVVTDRGTYLTSHLVATAGAWTAQLVRDLGVTLRVTRQVVSWRWPRAPETFALGRFPCWAIEDDAPGFAGLWYGFPLLPAGAFGGERGVKTGHHLPGETADPEHIDRTPRASEIDAVVPALRAFLPDAEGPVLAAKVCMYTMTQDGHFAIGRHPRNEAVTVACGFSGHGFKFAPVIGEALADLAISGRSELPLSLFALDRFGAT